MRISLNFYELYRNDCQLTCWNQNCDIPIRFGTPVCQINEYSPISAESQRNFHILPHFNSKTTEPIFTIFFTRSRAVSGAINACLCKTIVPFVSECESKKWRRQFRRWQKSPEINWLPWQRPLDYCENYGSLIICMHAYTKAETLVKIG